MTVINFTKWAALSTSVAAMIVTGLFMAGVFHNGKPVAKPMKDIAEKLRNEISAQNIGRFHKQLTSVPHLAGTDQDFQQADWVRQKFVEYGMDQVDVVPYSVLLSYPNMKEPNKVYLLDANRRVRFFTSGRQKPLFSPEESSSLITPDFNAYSGTGIAEGGLVYVYYGRESEYQYLAQQGVNVSGHIVLARYGGTFRGNIVHLAEKKGAIGVILYADPKDYAKQGRNRTYPETLWMPGSAVQMGTTRLTDGDPLTPFYPSLPGAYRIAESEARLPRIPVQPISYDEAEVLLKSLEAKDEAPAKWQGELDVKYYLGPNLKSAGWKVKMDVKTSNKMATIHNTIGVIRGHEEPDRYVLLGNHRDAWTFGAVDPASGTAAMIELARAFGKMKQNHGWRPRRSLVFCSWAAEEYGLIGSYEWVEEHAKVLATRAVAYINVDNAVVGNGSLVGKAAPLLQSVIAESAKKIANPDPAEVSRGRKTVFDTWIKTHPDRRHPLLPKIGTPGSGSDDTSFMHFMGIPIVDIAYDQPQDMPSLPLYHTVYETHYLIANLIDKGFLFHRAMAQLWGEITLSIAESVVLPFDVRRYSSYLTDSYKDIKKRYAAQLEANGATLKYFETAVNNFTKAAGNFASSTLRQLELNNPLAVRRVNDQLTQLERHFVDPRGLPNRPEYNHIVFAPSSSDIYESTSFAGLVDLLESVDGHKESDRPVEWAQIKQHLAVIAFLIEAAAKSLSELL